MFFGYFVQQLPKGALAAAPVVPNLTTLNPKGIWAGSVMKALNKNIHAMCFGSVRHAVAKR